MIDISVSEVTALSLTRPMNPALIVESCPMRFHIYLRIPPGRSSPDIPDNVLIDNRTVNHSVYIYHTPHLPPAGRPIFLIMTHTHTPWNLRNARQAASATDIQTNYIYFYCFWD